MSDTPVSRGIMTGTDDVSGLLPAKYGKLVVQPVKENTIAYKVATQVHTTGNSFIIPIVGKDSTADWVPEGGEIAESEGKFGQVMVLPKKVAGLTVISRELALDSSPSATTIVGDGLARSISQKVDAAFFGDTPEYGPRGLEDVPGVNEVAAPAAWTDLDPFAEAIADAQLVGATVNTFVAHPDDAKALAVLKDQAESNRPLLGADATEGVRHRLQGVPLMVSPSVTPGTVWGIPKEFVIVVTREGAEIAVDHSIYFTSDRIAIRAIMRIGFAYPHPEAIQKIMLDK